MFKIEYEIKLNEVGRPCIDLPLAYEHRAEDKFFAIEMARYFLQRVYTRRSAEFDQQAAENINIGIQMLGQVGDEMAEILWKGMKANGDFELMMKRTYHVMVSTIEERDALPTTGIQEGGRIYMREEGLKVFVKKENKIYELQNDNWIEIL